MSKAKSPAFQWYPKDFETDEVAACMSLSERGAYITLLGYCWLEGSIPDDLPKLAKLCRCSESELRKAWPAVAQKFTMNESGRLVNPRMEEERIKQDAWREKSAAGGRRSVDARIRACGSSNPRTKREPNVNQTVNGRLKPFVNSSSSSSSSSPKDETKDVSSDATSDVTFLRIWNRHPKKTAPNYAESAFAQILLAADDIAETEAQIEAAHIAWCRFWEDSGTQAQYVPKLMDWLNGGDWKVDPGATTDEPEYPKVMM